MKQRSIKIQNLSFFMMLAIVWTHSRLPRWEIVPDYFQQLLIFNEIGEDAVAPFFLITGFLFFRNFHINKYSEKLKTRFRSLVIPYLLWNALGALAWFLVISSTGNQYVSDRFYFDSWTEVIGNILGCKYTVLWYVGVIIVYALAAPVFYYLARSLRTAVIAVIIFLIIGIAFHHPFASPLVWMSIYMMGALLGVHYNDYLFKPQPLWITFLALVAFPVSVWLSHQYDSMLCVNLRAWTSVFFYIGLYDLLDKVFHFAPHRIYRYSFFLYATHYIPVHVLQRYVIANMGNTVGCWIAYLLIPPLVVFLCVSVAYFLDEKVHRLYAILSGDR
ncbi:MAG: acyltransferase [Prevotella sp.]|nr:acyltransferase [Prevotella sp.]